MKADTYLFNYKMIGKVSEASGLYWNSAAYCGLPIPSLSVVLSISHNRIQRFEKHSCCTRPHAVVWFSKRNTIHEHSISVGSQCSCTPLAVPYLSKWRSYSWLFPHFSGRNRVMKSYTEPHFDVPFPNFTFQQNMWKIQLKYTALNPWSS
jgi:hypothetical protein